MKILYDHQAFSLQSAGGITRYFNELAGRLAQVSDVQPAVWFGVSRASPVESAAVHRVGWKNSLFSPGLPTYAINEVLLNALALTSTKFDIYHNTLYRFMPLVRTNKFVATHHDCIQERFPEMFKDRERIFRAKRQMFQRADMIFCVSESSRADLEEFYGVGPARTKVVYNGVSEMKRTAKGHEELKTVLGNDQQDFILYVGRRDSYKNFVGLVNAIRNSGVHRTHKLVCLGGGNLTSDERRLIQDNGLNDAITVVPQSSADLLAESYASAALFVYPSLYEGFGLPPLEAMQMRCPSLVARSTATVEVCGDAAFFFDPYSIHEFSEMLKYSLCDKGARDAAVERGLQVSRRYSWDRTAAEVLAGYREIL